MNKMALRRWIGYSGDETSEKKAIEMVGQRLSRGITQFFEGMYELTDDENKKKQIKKFLEKRFGSE